MIPIRKNILQSKSQLNKSTVSKKPSGPASNRFKFSTSLPSSFRESLTNYGSKNFCFGHRSFSKTKTVPDSGVKFASKKSFPNFKPAISFLSSGAHNCRLTTPLGKVRNGIQTSDLRGNFFSTSTADSSVFTIDCNYTNQKHMAAAYLLKEGNVGAFIDNNTNHALPYLKKSLEAAQLSPKDIKYIIVTHIHLDHAGATSSLTKLCPNATVLCHPRAQRHLVDPSRLIQGVKTVYGEEAYNEMYGEINPIDEKRVKTCEDNQIVELKDRKLQFLHTRGHAKHHFVIHDHKSNSVFSGDAFGVSYVPILRQARLLDNVSGITEQDFIFPSSSPTDFEPLEAHKAVDRIVNTGCDRIFLTHFGVWDNPKEGATQMHEGIDFLEGLMKELQEYGLSQGISKKDFYGNPILQQYGEEKLANWFTEKLHQRNMKYEHFKDTFRTDLELNVQGLLVAAGRE